MRISTTTRPTPNQPKTVVSAYIDGKSTHIEALKLDAVDRFEKAQESSHGSLLVTIDGQRHNRGKDVLLFSALGLAPTLAFAGVGYSLAGSVGAAAGGALGAAVALLPATYFLHRASKAPQWTPDSRLTLGQAAVPSPVDRAGAERLRSLVDENRANHPEARQILFLSGHGDRQEVAHMKITEMGEAMNGAKLDATIVDACLLGQLEVLTHMVGWAGMVLVSPHKILAKGLELPKLLSPENLAIPDITEASIAMAGEAKSTTPSFAVIDSEKFREKLLPTLDELGEKLSQSERGALTKVLRKSLGTDGWISRRVDLGSFLTELTRSGLAPEEAKAAREAFSETVPFQKNEHSLSFDLKAGQNDPSLPTGWRNFLQTLNRGFKPVGFLG